MDDDRDTRDYRVMLAREVWTERAWRINGKAWRPADFARGEQQGRDFAAELEKGERRAVAVAPIRSRTASLLARRSDATLSAMARVYRTDSQKRGYDRVRRQRLKAFHNLYSVHARADRERCYYCKRRRADTLDHCPSLIAVACLGVHYFEARGIPFVLIPACRDCNNTSSRVLRRGRVVHFDVRKATAEVRKRSRALARTVLRKGTDTARRRRRVPEQD